jgi:hypothetical protein
LDPLFVDLMLKKWFFLRFIIEYCVVCVILQCISELVFNGALPI